MVRLEDVEVEKVHEFTYLESTEPLSEPTPFLSHCRKAISDFMGTIT